MVMRIGVTTNDTDIRLATSLRTRSNILIEALVDKLQFLMTELQAKARAGVPSKRVQDSITNPEGKREGDLVVGTLDWGNVPVEYMGGNVYDLAQIFEHGTRPHYPINPLTDRYTGKGTRAHTKGAKERFGTGSPVLRWEEGGKAIFRPYAFHPGLPATNFMANAIEDMKDKIKEELRDVTLTSLEPE